MREAMKLLNYEVMNFGFSGNGRGQKEMADMGVPKHFMF